MLDKRGLNKKGQEGITLSTLLLIVLGIVVVVIVILGFTGAFDFIFGKINLFPGQSLQTVVSSCQIAAQSQLTADYCSTFKKISTDRGTEYINCKDSRVETAIDQTIAKPDCSTAGGGQIAVIASECASLIKAGVKTPIIVNGDSSKCSSMTCANDLKGIVIADKTQNCPTAGQKKITAGLTDVTGNQACCAAP